MCNTSNKVGFCGKRSPNEKIVTLEHPIHHSSCHIVFEKL